MTHPQLAIFGYSEAAMFLRGSPTPNVAAIVSIHGARELGVESSIGRRLDLAFDDVDISLVDDVRSLQQAMIRKRRAEEYGLLERPPESADAEALIRFAETLRHTEGVVLCHCGAGMSRAPAAALICLATWRGPDTESHCVEEILRLRPGAMPHEGLVRFADEVLDRKGMLVAALDVARR